VSIRQIFNTHLVANEFTSCWFNIFKRLEGVVGVEGVRWSTSRLELIDTGSALLNISVGEVELGFIQLEVKHARTSSHHITSSVEVGSVNFGRGPNLGLST
jgi:hypothetical protein